MTHKTIVCSCGKQLSTCRCSAPNKPKVVSDKPCTHVTAWKSPIPREVIFDWDKVRTPEVLTVDGEPFPLAVTDAFEPEAVTLREGPAGLSYLVIGLLADKVEIIGEPPSARRG